MQIVDIFSRSPLDN